MDERLNKTGVEVRVRDKGDLYPPGVVKAFLYRRKTMGGLGPQIPTGRVWVSFGPGDDELFHMDELEPFDRQKFEEARARWLWQQEAAPAPEDEAEAA
jgi:hypothetical protein